MHKSNFHYVATPTMTSQILKYLHLARTQKSIYLENETFFLQIKKTKPYTKLGPETVPKYSRQNLCVIYRLPAPKKVFLKLEHHTELSL